MQRIITALVMGAAFTTSAWAGATLQTITPEISLNQGDGYKQVAAATAVSNGDQIMAGPGGRGRIVYPDGCVTDVYPGGVVTVGKCYRPMRAGLEQPVVEERAVPWVPLAAGAAVVGVGICAVAGYFDDDDGRGPRSP
jgi:hypothetical protein